MKKARDIIAVWFSCGAASAVAAKKTVELYGKTHNIVIVNTPVYEEDIDNQRFLDDVSGWIGHPIIRARNGELKTDSANDVWKKERYMSNPFGAPCTRIIKKGARYQFERENDIKWHVLGFTYGEMERHYNFVKSERSNVLPILICQGITKKDCFKIISDAGIELPRIYKLGYPNANCIGCVKATSPTYWNHVRKVHPDQFKERAELSRELGARLARHKGKRIFLDELPPDAKGRPMKSLPMPDCGIFCDTK